MTRPEIMEVALALATFFSSVVTALFSKLVTNIVALNQKIAVVIERVDSHEKRLHKLENS